LPLNSFFFEMGPPQRLLPSISFTNHPHSPPSLYCSANFAPPCPVTSLFFFSIQVSSPSPSIAPRPQRFFCHLPPVLNPRRFFPRLSSPPAPSLSMSFPFFFFEYGLPFFVFQLKRTGTPGRKAEPPPLLFFPPPPPHPLCSFRGPRSEVPRHCPVRLIVFFFFSPRPKNPFPDGTGTHPPKSSLFLAPPPGYGPFRLIFHD